VTSALPKSSGNTPAPRALNGLLTKATTAKELLELHERYGSAFNHVNLATCWSQLGRVRPGGERKWILSDGGARLGALREQTRERVLTFGARGLSSTAHALAKLALRGAAWASLWNEIARAALARRSEFEPQALANTAWAFATAGHAAPALFEAVGEEAAKRIHEFSPQNLANTAWAFATAGHAAPALLDAIAGESAGRVREFTPQALANTAWAFATAGHTAPALFVAITDEAVRRVGEFNPQALANTAWAFATAGHAASVLFEAIAEESAGRMREFKPQALANTAWAFATAGHAAPAFFEAIAKEGVGRVREFSPQNLANTAWAFAKAGHAAPALFEVIAKEAAERMREFSPQNLANTVWVFATAGHASPALFDAIAKESAGRVREFNPQELTNTAWGFATAGHAAPALLDAIAVVAAGREREFKPQELANIAWAYAASDHLAVESTLFDQRFARRCDALNHDFNTQGLCQLHQWRLWYASERACSDGLPGAALLARCDAAFRAAEAQPSRLQTQVAQTLVSLGVSIQEEVALEEGYSLDLVVTGAASDWQSRWTGRPTLWDACQPAPRGSSAGSWGTLDGGWFRCPTGSGTSRNTVTRRRSVSSGLPTFLRCSRERSRVNVPRERFRVNVPGHMLYYLLYNYSY